MQNNKNKLAQQAARPDKQMNSPRSEYVVVGQIGSPYGVLGWVKVSSFTEMVTNILAYSPWYLEERTNWKLVEVSASREHGKGIIVKLAGIETPEEARLLAGKKIAIERSKLPVLKENEYYWNDLKGMAVINQRGENLGTVIYIMATGSNDVLVVKDKKEHAIPFLLNDVITHVDMDKKMIHVDWETL
jgi:16S rRNA processing protein RimM